MAQPDFKIRTLPRGSEKKAAEASSAAPKRLPLAKIPRWIIYVGTSAIVALLGAFALPGAEFMAKPIARSTANKMTQTELASIQDPVSAKVSRHLQNSYLKEEVRRQAQALQNARVKDPSLSEETLVADDDDDRNYGVTFEQEDVSDKLYKDLNSRQPMSLDYLPEERINARLANNKWVNEHDRTERINFVRNFILSAYERGYEVEIDANLVVVGVKKINRKLSIDQVIDKMAKQGF